MTKMPSERKIYSWENIHTTPCSCGVYAWYYSLPLRDTDIFKLIENLKSDSKRAKTLVTEFLQMFLFQPILEEPFNAIIKGPLKPTYEGKLVSLPTITLDLIDRIVADPKRLWTLKNVLDVSVPEFASPIYIGMSKNLNDRLSKHKKLIKHYKDNKDTNEVNMNSDLLKIENNRDQSFAFEVFSRGLSENKLSVAIRLINVDENEHVDIENILNRIIYPLCGKN